MFDQQTQLQNLIQELVAQSGSDIHLSEGRVPVIRVAKDLRRLTNYAPLDYASIEGMLSEAGGDALVKLVRNKQEVDFSAEWQGVRLRGNAFWRRRKLSVAFRLIPKVRTLKELGLPQELERFALLKQGFFIITGPVGQGKSTTLAAMIQHINQTRSEHIVTIENPIEYVFDEERSVIDQRQVGLDTENFEDALWAAFRQDANVIMIGEMRTPETIAAAVTAAETGHLVLSTLHTNNASQTIDRIIDSFPSDQQSQIRTQLANSLAGIFSMRLIPSLTGGLVPAYELLINTKAVANLIRENRTHEIDIVIETGREHGMIDLNHSLAELVSQGKISVENAHSYSLNAEGLITMLGT